MLGCESQWSFVYKSLQANDWLPFNCAQPNNSLFLAQSLKSRLQGDSLQLHGCEASSPLHPAPAPAPGSRWKLINPVIWAGYCPVCISFPSEWWNPSNSCPPLRALRMFTNSPFASSFLIPAQEVCIPQGNQYKYHLSPAILISPYRHGK